ncbi:MAG: hypothetical protein JXR56_00480 [Candidatus Cloacimonetes bacterium]|nr:hypothetical protein [Candidatus Cloacimonadota bacterium]
MKNVLKKNVYGKTIEEQTATPSNNQRLTTVTTLTVELTENNTTTVITIELSNGGQNE